LCTSLLSFGLGIWLFSAGSTPTELQADEPTNLLSTIEAQPLADLTSLKEQGIEVLNKGPVHEAFAQPTAKNPEAGPIIHKEPPKAIEELPPDQKPEGDNVQWIKGYWAWDAERNDFLWVSGFWRVPPPDRQWVAGYWTQVDDGWQWVPGYWASTQQSGQAYLPAPPDSIDYGPSVPAPSDDAFYVPGNWVYTNYDYAWQPGYWSYYRPGFIWNPACYHWTPYGYTYCSGYWDYPWWNRGLLFAPCWFHRPIFLNTGFFFHPFFAINTPFLSTFFFLPHHHHFFFGNFGDPFFHHSGFQVASFNQVNNSVNITNINNINSNNVTNVVTNRATAGPVLAPATRVAANTRLGAGVTTSGGVTRLNTASGRPSVVASGSVGHPSQFGLSRAPVNSVDRVRPNHVTNSSQVTSPAHGSGTLSSPGRTVPHASPAPSTTRASQAPAIRTAPSAPNVSHNSGPASSPTVRSVPSSPHVSHYTGPSASPTIRSAPSAPHVSHSSAPAAPHATHNSAPAAPHVSSPAFHNSTPSHSSGGGHVAGSGGGGHSSSGGHSGGGGGGHSGSGGHAGSGGGHSGGGGHGHR
jgi:hypothetical protein